MRTSDIVGIVFGSLLGMYNTKRVVHAVSEDASSWLEIFSINISICVVCFFLNPDIMVFNMYFFNGDSILDAYKKSIVDSEYYFPESPMLLMLFIVSLLFSIISILSYLYVTRKTAISNKSAQSTTTSTTSASPTSTTK